MLFEIWLNTLTTINMTYICIQGDFQMPCPGESLNQELLPQGDTRKAIITLV